MISFLVETTQRRAQLESPQEVVGLLEVRTNSSDFMDQIFHAGDTVFAQSLFDLAVASDTNTLIIDTAITTLVAQHLDSLQVRITPSYIRFNLLEHIEGSLVESDEGTIVNLSQTEQLEDLTALRRDTEDTK